MSNIATASQLSTVEIYDPITPNIFDNIYRVGETTCGTVLYSDVLYVIFQGTENRAGWLADADIMPLYHSVLGNLHSGFYQNLPAMILQLAAHIKTLLPTIPTLKIIVSGHSKGAGEGAIAGPLLELTGFNVVQLILFACPNAGYQRLADWIAENMSGSVSYRNAPSDCTEFGDPVPLVPTYPFVPPVPHTAIDVPPAGAMRLIDVEWHMGGLYQTGCSKL